MMICQQFQQLVETADDRRETPEIERFTRHLAECAACRAFWQQRKLLHEALHRLQSNDSAAASAVDLSSRVVAEWRSPMERTELPGVPDREIQASRVRGWAGVVAGLAAVGLLVAVMRQHPSPDQPPAVTDGTPTPTTAVETTEVALPQLLSQARSAYGLLAADAIASVTDVVDLSATSSSTVPAAEDGSAETSSTETVVEDEAATEPAQFRDTFDFLRQLIPTPPGVTL